MEERMDISELKYSNYIPIFDESDYVRDLRNGNGKQYFNISYQVDARILNFGNLAIYHYVRIYDKGNPQSFTVRMITINVQIKPEITLAEKLWCTVTPNTVNGDAGQSKQVTLMIFSTKVKQVYWNPSQPYDSIRPEYVFCIGDKNYDNTNYSVTINVIIPQACAVPRIVTLKVFEVLNTFLSNSCILTVTGTPSDSDFMFSIIPLTAPYTEWGQKNIFRATITTKNGQPDDFFVGQKTNATCFDTVINGITGGSTEYAWYLGNDNEIVFNIIIQLLWNAANGSYVIQFTAYTYNQSNYVRKSLILVIGAQKGKDTTTTTTTITGTNMTMLTNMFGITPVTLPTQTGLMALALMLVQSTGLPIMAVLFLIGLIFVGIAIFIVAPLVHHPLLQMFFVMPVVFFDCLLGLWPSWVLILLGIWGAGMLSYAAVRIFTGGR
jgi:hypothetical protein